MCPVWYPSRASCARPCWRCSARSSASCCYRRPRADLAQAPPERRDRLAQQVLAAQRTLLVIDSFESAAFLRHLPHPTKALITSPEWLDAAAVTRLGGLDAAEALEFLRGEAARQNLLIACFQQRLNWRGEC